MGITSRCSREGGKRTDEIQQIRSIRDDTTNTPWSNRCIPLLLVLFFVCSVASRNLGLFNAKHDDLLSSTLTPEQVHLTVNEHGYSPEEEYQYIQQCVEKCMQTRTESKSNRLDNGRDNCIQLHCRIYE